MTTAAFIPQTPKALYDSLGLEFSEYVLFNFIKNVQEKDGQFNVIPRPFTSRQKPHSRLYEVVQASTVDIKSWQAAKKLLDRNVQKGILEISPDSTWLKLTDKYLTIFNEKLAQYSGNKKDTAPKQGEGKKGPTILFSESPYADDYDLFETEVKAAKDFKRADIDYTHYYNRCADWSASNGAKKNWISWVVMIMDDDLKKNDLHTMKPKEERKNRMNDEELNDTLNLFFEKLSEPETDSFEEYKETYETWKDLATQALKRGDRILNEKGKAKVQQWFDYGKDTGKLRKVFEWLLNKQKEPPNEPHNDIINLAKKLKPDRR